MEGDILKGCLGEWKVVSSKNDIARGRTEQCKVMSVLKLKYGVVGGKEWLRAECLKMCMRTASLGKRE